MPLFEYQCEDCGHVTSFLEKADEKADEKGTHECEKCGSKTMKKLFSTFAAQIKDSSGGCSTGTCPLK